MNAGFPAARDQMALWKSEQIREYAKAFLQAGLDKPYVGSDDVAIDTQGAGIAGSAVTMLRSAHIISDYYGHHPGEGIVHGRRKSKRESANGRKVALYVVNRPWAEEWLVRNGVSLVRRQIDMFMDRLCLKESV